MKRLAKALVIARIKDNAKQKPETWDKPKRGPWDRKKIKKADGGQVTDPTILAQLNGDDAKPVTDPSVLAQLNGDNPAPSWSDAITDIPHEIGSEASNAWGKIAALGNRSDQGPIEGLMTTGKAALAIPQLIASPLTGAARSLIGHPMAQAEHAVGSVIAPDIAAKDDPAAMYENSKGDVDTAMSAVRPAGAPVKVPGASLTAPHPTVPGATVTTTPRGAYEWQAPMGTPNLKPVGVAKQPETEDFFNSADNHYDNMRGFGVEIDPAAMNRVADNIYNELHAEGYRPRNAPKVFDAVEELRNPAGQNHEISDIDSVRKVLGKARMDPSERDAARRAIGHIDDYLADLGNNPHDVVVNPHFAARVGDEATAARADYAVAKRSEDIDDALDQAERQAGRSGAGHNINNAIRQRLSALRNNRKKMAGWNDAEKAELDSVISGTTTANAARQAGKFAPHGIVSTVMSTAAGHAIAPGIGTVAVPTAGLVARLVGDRLTRLAAERLQNVVKARSPLGRQTQVNAAAQSALASPQGPSGIANLTAAGLPSRLASLPQRQGVLVGQQDQ